MLEMMKKILMKVLPQPVLNVLKKKHQELQYDKWKKEGCPAPPPHLVKQLTIREYQQKYQVKTLVETGTYMGDMVEAQKKNFARIISIELGAALAEKAKKRFKNNNNVKIVIGDSGKALPGIMADINEPAIFWLDGHFSSGITAKGETECPIYEELDAIFNGKNLEHILLIDDARCFNGEGDYPAIETLTNYVKSKNANYTVEVKDDIMRYTVEGRR
jgi:hypothetical protein